MQQVCVSVRLQPAAELQIGIRIRGSPGMVQFPDPLYRIFQLYITNPEPTSVGRVRKYASRECNRRLMYDSIVSQTPEGVRGADGTPRDLRGSECAPTI